jgi:hypothetical protein
MYRPTAMRVKAKDPAMERSDRFGNLARVESCPCRTSRSRWPASSNDRAAL